jgi:hypothetical protein
LGTGKEKPPLLRFSRSNGGVYTTSHGDTP